MAAFFRLLALSLLLHLSSHALAGNSIGKDDLDAQKELLLLKIDSGKELLQKDIEAQGKRLDAIDKRIDDQVSRVSDIGNAVDRFGITAAWISTLITILLAAGGVAGYFSVAQKVQKEAETVAKTESNKWFDNNLQSLRTRIQELENVVEQGHEKIGKSVADVQSHSQSAINISQFAINTLQNLITSDAGGNPKLSPEDEEGLRASAKQLKGKAEANYSFNDWNIRAFAASQVEQFEDAALFWKYAAKVPDAGTANVVQALFNRAVAILSLKRKEEAITLFDQLIATHAGDKDAAVREQIAYALNGSGFARLLAAKQSWADRDQAVNTLKRAETDLQACLDRKPHYWGLALGNLAYVQWLLQRPSESEATFRTALKSMDHGGEQLYKDTLVDIGQYPIPEDAEFKDMVERLWAEYQGSLPAVN